MDREFSAKELAAALGVSVSSTTRKIDKFQTATRQVILHAAMAISPNAGNAANAAKAFRAWLRTYGQLHAYDSERADRMIDEMLTEQIGR